ncbi:CueP family metal-binding protein [Nocardioides massiliensis]|uniref:CueP family metal-binding protein n=1 Tax=Nocardioides massiliensis TaxID=1325935 RepID=UPI00248437F1|nr:CueP family metal-binding protein [Nocardioides massiliensis]
MLGAGRPGGGRTEQRSVRARAGTGRGRGPAGWTRPGRDERRADHRPSRQAGAGRAAEGPDGVGAARGADAHLGRREVSLDVPEDRFYLAVAPYVDQTHECFYHSLTTCLGELDSADVRVKIVDEANDEVLVDEVRTTFDNGFLGFWLPRDIERGCP